MIGILHYIKILVVSKWMYIILLGVQNKFSSNKNILGGLIQQTGKKALLHGINFLVTSVATILM